MSNVAATSCKLVPESAVTRALRSLYLSRCLPLGQRTWAPGEDTRGSNGATAKPRIGVPRRACDPTSGPKRPRGRHACDKRLQPVCNSPVVCLSKCRMHCIWASPLRLHCLTGCPLRHLWRSRSAADRTHTRKRRQRWRTQQPGRSGWASASAQPPIVRECTTSRLQTPWPDCPRLPCITRDCPPRRFPSPCGASEVDSCYNTSRSLIPIPSQPPPCAAPLQVPAAARSSGTTASSCATLFLLLARVLEPDAHHSER